MEPIAESDQLLSIFPAEIWLLIGEKVSQVEDHLHLRDSSHYFRVLFKSLLDRAMFPEVAKVLYKQLQRYPYKIPQVIGKCRLICRHWQESVDAVVQMLPDSIHGGWFGPINTFGGAQRFPDIIIIQTGANITPFRQHFDETHAGTNRNPFARRKVYIHYEPEYTQDFIEQVLQFLRDYGHHIWYCHIVLVTPEHGNIPLIMYRKMYEMLKLMPNMLTLSLSCIDGPMWHEATLSDELKTFFTTHQFPTLKHLKFFHKNTIPSFLSKSLMRSNSQITVLHESCHNINVKTVSFNENLPQLEQLTTSLNNKQQFITLKHLKMNLPLSKLHLTISCQITTKALFALLGKRWSATLKQLSLDLKKDMELIDVVPLQLPNLQVFEITSLSFVPLDFFLPAKYFLETLSVLVNTRDLPDPESKLQSALAAENTVKFLDFRNNLIQSNIWSVFPKLRSVNYKESAVGREVKPHVCRRFDLLQKQNDSI